MKRILCAIAALLATPALAIHDVAVTVDENTATDSRCFAPYLKQSMPDINLDEGDSINLILRDYVVAGDDDVTDSPVCGDVNPSIIVGGDAITGVTLDASDVDLAEYGGTTTSSSAGTGTLTFTFDNSVGDAIVEEVDWNVNDIPEEEPEPEPVAGVALPASAYCVAANGNDLNNGHFPNCWRTTAKVNSFNFQPGDDVYFRAGDTFTLTSKLSIHWAGTGHADNQRVIVGSFYVSNGQAFINTPTNWSDVSARYSEFNYTGTPPVLQGPYKESCRNSVAFGGEENKCPYQFSSTYRTTNWAQAVPATYYDAMVDVSGSKYVTIQDLEITGSSGQCVKTSVKPAKYCINGDADCQQNTIIQRNKIHHCAGSAINMVYSTHNIVRYNDFALADLAIGDQLPGWREEPGGFRGGSAINIVGCYPCYDLIEANDVHDQWGENFGFYGIASALNGFILTRGNYSANAKSVGLNIGATQDQVIEQNIIAGDVSDTAGPNDPRALQLGRCSGLGGCGPSFWALGHENDNTSVAASYPVNPGARVMRRNNILAMEHASALHVYSIASRGTDQQKLEQWDFGNTVYTTTGDSIRYSIATANPVRIVELQNYNNLYINHAGSCGADLGTNASKVKIDFNLWTVLTSGGACRGINDVVSTNIGFSTAGFSAFSWANFPDALLFKPSAGGAGQNKGKNLRTTDYLGNASRNAIWQVVLDRRRWLPDCNTTGEQVPVADWRMGLKFDYCGNPRTDDDMGAFSH